MTKRIEEIDLAKGIGIILVVIGHSIPDANTGIQSVWGGYLFSWIYSFHMALFMTMSGMLFYKKSSTCISKGEKIQEITKRTKRLLVPYIFYSIVMLLAKAISSLGRSPVGLNTLVSIAFGDSPCGNMWFLWTLFILSVVVLYCPIIRGHEGICVIIAIGLYMFQNAFEWFSDFGISKVLNMTIWFLLGMYMRKKIEVSEKTISLNRNVLIAAVFLILHTVCWIIGQNVELDTLSIIYKWLVAFLGVMLIWALSGLVYRLKTDNKIKKLLLFLGMHSMEIYVLSYFIQTPAVTVYSKVGNLGIPYSVWVIALVLGSTVFAVVSAHLIRKSKWLKLVMLGEG